LLVWILVLLHSPIPGFSDQSLWKVPKITNESVTQYLSVVVVRKAISDAIAKGQEGEAEYHSKDPIARRCPSRCGGDLNFFRARTLFSAH